MISSRDVRTTISSIRGRQVLDSRGNPTVEAEVVLAGGGFGRAAVPSGASTGSLEANEQRDGGSSYGGRGVLGAVGHVNEAIAGALVGRDAIRQEEIDQVMLDLDGTPNKANLGANAILSVSLAVARAAASAVGLPLFRYLGGSAARLLPVPCLNVLNGGAHASNSIDIQEFMLVPGGAPSFGEAPARRSRGVPRPEGSPFRRGSGHQRGRRGGFAPDLPNDRAALELLSRVVEAAGYRLGDDIAFAIDVAATELYRDGRYELDGEEPPGRVDARLPGRVGRRLPAGLDRGRPRRGRLGGLGALTARLGDRCQLVGDDLFVTNEEILRRGIEQGTANAILVKVNQIGTLSETVHTMELAATNGYGRMVSHRRGRPRTASSPIWRWRPTPGRSSPAHRPGASAPPSTTSS